MQLLEHFASLTLHPKNAQEVKVLILKLAVLGKLTANWRSENSNIEPISVLLKKIKVNKSIDFYQLNKNEIPFVIPETWVWSKLGKLCSVQTGKKDANYGTDNGEYNFYTCAQKPIKSPTYTFEGESIILPGNGANVGLVTFVNEKFEAYQRTYVLNNFSPLYPLYIKTALEALWKDNLGRQYGSAINYIKIGNITEFKFPIPPLEEQKEIVRVVEILFKEVEQLEQLTVERIALKNDYVSSALQQLTSQNSQKEWQSLQPHFKDFFTEKSTIKKLRETVLQLAVQGKLTADWRTKNTEVEHASELLKRIQKEKAQLIRDKKIPKEKPYPKIDAKQVRYELPKDWVWCNLGESIVLLSGRDLTPNEYSDNELKYPYLTGASQIKEDNIILSRWTNTPKVLSFLGDVLISVKGTIGKTVINKVGEIHIARQIMALRSYNWVEIQFLKLFADSYLSNLQEASNGIIPGVSREHLLYAEFPLPPLEEQKIIVEKVNALMVLCDALEQEVAQSNAYSEQLMQSVLREVFEGEKG